MIRQILFIGGADKTALAHAVCCEWVRQSRALGDVARVRDLEDSMMCCEGRVLAAGWQGVHDACGLPAGRIVSIERFSAEWLAAHCANVQGYALIILGRGGMDLPGSPDRKGHTTAVRKEPGKIQYFDPGFGTLVIDTVQELRQWLIDGIGAPGRRHWDLCQRSCALVQL